MPRILADHNVERHVQVMVGLLASPAWSGIWELVGYEVESFDRLGIGDDTVDTELWRLCQEREIVLITANRNAQGPTSLEVAIQTLGTPRSLPVITIGDPDRLLRDREYARRAAAQLLEYLLDIERLRGAGRLYVP
jgi:hypothetical protein